VKKVVLIFLFLLVVGLRLHDLSAPAIGYHNMKEIEALSVADTMEMTGNFLDRKTTFDNWLTDKPMTMYAQIPWVSYQVVACRKLFGDSLAWPRLVNIFYMALSVSVFFEITLLLDLSFLAAVCSSVVLAIMPLTNFFSRNLQPESGAFFWMLCSVFVVLKFLRDGRLRWVYLFSLCVAVTASYKMSFLFPLISFGVFVPDLLKRSRGRLLHVLFALILCPAFLVWWFYLTGQLSFNGSAERIGRGLFFSLGYWKDNGQIFWSYLTENYGLCLWLFSSVGTLFALPGIFANKKYARFVAGSLFSAGLYCWFFSDYLRMHSYYQFPYAYFVALTAGFFISGFGETYVRICKRPTVYGGLMAALLFAVALPDVIANSQRSYRTKFYGQDVVGKELAPFLKRNEKIVRYGQCQEFAVCRYAGVQCGSADTLDDFIEVEEKIGLRYVLFSEYGRTLIAPSVWDYIKEHYSIKVVGFVPTNNGAASRWFVLERGGRYDYAGFWDSYGSAARVAAVYGDVPYVLVSAFPQKESHAQTVLEK